MKDFICPNCTSRVVIQRWIRVDEKGNTLEEDWRLEHVV